ncbi:hypothetical protein KPL39_16720 [Clostridium gasigenes]|uniref:hypothetical protein n=1 Tax=Clostridium gasigenes TaxID=94869 RepID=UPI001C0BEE61|nr:hypothetical protein [Clostridium gasigenes]MBU3137887.1 hypothetical protein [Clostridium gasigenes]
MGELKSKDIVTAICMTAAMITSVIIICTFLTTYQFFYVGQIFNSYYMLQMGVCITMMLWGIRFLLYHKGKERYIYFLICITISVSLIFFIINLVN